MSRVDTGKSSLERERRLKYIRNILNKFGLCSDYIYTRKKLYDLNYFSLSNLAEKF